MPARAPTKGVTKLIGKIDVTVKQMYHFPIVFVGPELPEVLTASQIPHRIHHIIREEELDRIPDVVPILIFQTSADRYIDLARKISATFSPTVLLALTDGSRSVIAADTFSQQVIYRPPHDLSLEDLQTFFSEGTQRLMHQERQAAKLTTKLLKLAGTKLDLKNEQSAFAGILSELCDILHAEGALLLTNHPTLMIYGVDATNGKTIADYTRRPPSDLQLCEQFGWHPTRLYRVEVNVLENANGTLVLNSDLQPVMLARLEPVLHTVGQKMLFMLAQQNLQQQNLLDELPSSLMRGLIGAYSLESIQQMLCSYIQKIDGVRHAIAWHQVPVGENNRHYLSTQDNASVVAALEDVDEGRLLVPLDELRGEEGGPLRLARGTTRGSGFERLFGAVGCDEVYAVPLRSAFIQGCLLITTQYEGALGEYSLSVVEQMTNDASHMLERQLLLDWTENKINWLETAASYIHDGILYIGEAGRVDYVNPQFSGQTGLSIDQIVNQNRDTLFRLLASIQADTDASYEQLTTCFAGMIQGQGERTIPLKNTSGEDIQLIIHPLDESYTEETTWIGIVRHTRGGQSARISTANPTNPAEPHKTIPYKLLSYLKSHQTYTESLLKVFTTEQRYQDRELRAQIQNNLLTAVQQMGALLTDALTVTSQIPTKDADFDADTVDIYRLLLSSMNTMDHHPNARLLRLAPADTKYKAQVNPMDITQTVERLLTYILEETTPGTPVQILLQNDLDSIYIHITHDLQSKAYRLLEWALENDIYSHLSEIGLKEHISINIAKGLIAKNGGALYLRDSDIVIELTGYTEQSVSEHFDRVYADLQMPTKLEPTPPTPPASEPKPEAPTANSHTPSTNDKPPVERLLICNGNSQAIIEILPVLRTRGYDLNICQDADSCMVLFEQQMEFDLIIIDGKYLKRKDEPSLIELVRNHTHNPILVINDRSERKESIAALKAGADDYLALPINDEEILARVGALLRRNLERQSERLVRVQDLEIDLMNYKVVRDGEEISFTHMEFKLLRAMAIHAGQVLEHRQLLRLAWGPSYEDEKQQLWVYISRLRNKLQGDDDKRRKYIQTRSGIGYVLK